MAFMDFKMVRSELLQSLQSYHHQRAVGDGSGPRKECLRGIKSNPALV